MKKQRLRHASYISCAFLFIWMATRATTMADTTAYANGITAAIESGQQTELWEFGHLLWRPLGWALTIACGPLLQAVGWTPVMQATAGLIAINVVSSLIGVGLWYLLVLDLGGSPRFAAILSLALACGHGFLLYAHSGSSYVPGVACVTASLYALRRGAVFWGGVWYALATLLWFPYVLAGAGLLFVALAPRAWGEPAHEVWKQVRLQNGLWFVAIAGVCLLSVYGVGLWVRDITTVAEAKEWITEAGHGWAQSIRAIRMATGLPRSLLFLGRDGVLFRRFLFRDPFAPVSVMNLVSASLWKLGVFWVFLVALVHGWIRRRGWYNLVLVTAIAPVLVFAVFIFEPGSQERYMPALPFLLLGIAWLLLQRENGLLRMGQWVIAGFLVCMVANNCYAFLRPRVSGEDAASLQRIEGFRQKVTRTSLVVVASNQDLLTEVANRSPFGALNRPEPVPFYDLLEVSSTRIQTWREEFGERVAQSWAKGGEVWISKRMWAQKPEPEWFWVEGESPVVKWKDVPAFFSQFETDGDEGGPDGFLHLIRNEKNQSTLADAEKRP